MTNNNRINKTDVDLNKIEINPIKAEDKKWALSLLNERLGSDVIITRGKIHHCNQLPGFIATLNNKKVGFATYSINNNECEIITLDSLMEGKGIGTSLIKKIIVTAKKRLCKRVWLITTNDNTDVLKFYQKKGFVLLVVYPNAIKQSRRLKPGIPKVGINGIPIRDEIELEIRLR